MPTGLRAAWLNAFPRALADVGLVRRSPTTLVADPDYEPQLQAFLEWVVRPGWACVDVGAHHGLLTLRLAQLVGAGGRVVAFEAHPDNADELRRGLQPHPESAHVRIEQRAVTDGSSKTVFLHGGRNRASSEWNVLGKDVEGRATAAEIAVPAISLDEYFPGDSHVDLVKIDVEGAEGQVLRGMRRLLRAVRPLVVTEFHDDEGWRGRRELLDADYELYAVDGKRLDATLDTERVYHCVAAPREAPLPARPT